MRKIEATKLKILVIPTAAKSLNDDTDNHETSKKPMSLKKKETPELVEVNNQTAEPTRRKIWVCSMLLPALLLLFFIIINTDIQTYILKKNCLVVMFMVTKAGADSRY